MAVIKQISVYNGTQWQTNNIGANANNVTISASLLGRTVSDGKDLESFLVSTFPSTKYASEEVLMADSSGKIVSTGVSSTKLGYLRNVDYDINAKFANVDANINIKDGQRTGSLRTIGSMQESTSYKLGEHSLSQGFNTQASGNYSHSEGQASQAKGLGSHAQNIGTIAAGTGQTVMGKYNVESNSYAWIVGNGTSGSARNNAATLDWQGNLEVKGLNDEALVSQETLNKWNEILDID